MSKTRAENFSDGVFAVAATLLVFSVQVPDVRSNLGRALLNDWPAYAAYAISFATILVIWVNHHNVLDNLKSLDGTLLYLNGFMLMTVAIIPFPTFLLARYLGEGHDEAAAAISYGLVLSLTSLSFTLLSLYARKRQLVQERGNFGLYSLGQLLYPVGTAVCLLDFRLALAIYAAMVVYYAAYPLVWEAALRRR